MRSAHAGLMEKKTTKEKRKGNVRKGKEGEKEGGRDGKLEGKGRSRQKEEKEQTKIYNDRSEMDRRERKS